MTPDMAAPPPDPDSYQEEEWWEEEDRKKATVKANSIAFVPLDGSFYCGDDAGNVHRFDADGTLVAQLSPEQAEA